MHRTSAPPSRSAPAGRCMGLYGSMLVRQSMRTTPKETSARHRAVWACKLRTSAMRRRWRMSALIPSSRRAAHDLVRLRCSAGACSRMVNCRTNKELAC